MSRTIIGFAIGLATALIGVVGAQVVLFYSPSPIALAAQCTIIFLGGAACGLTLALR